MNKVAFAEKILPDVKEKLKSFCASHGLKQGYFVERAIEEKLAQAETMEDILEFKNLEYQESQAIDFSQYLKKRNV